MEGRGRGRGRWGSGNGRGRGSSGNGRGGNQQYFNQDQSFHQANYSNQNQNQNQGGQSSRPRRPDSNQGSSNSWVNKNNYGGSSSSRGGGGLSQGRGGTNRQYVPVGSQNNEQQQVINNPPISEFQSFGISQPLQQSPQSGAVGPMTPVKRPDNGDHMIPIERPDNDGHIIPIKRPDNGGKSAVRDVRLLVNHFLVTFDPQSTILHYNIDIKPDSPKSDLDLIKKKLFCEDSKYFPYGKIAYDGKTSIFSSVELSREFKVEVPNGQGFRTTTYSVTIKLAKNLELDKLEAYLNGHLQSIPREILQGMDLVMKEHPTRHRISIGKSFYPKSLDMNDHLGWGIYASRGFQHSLKPTSQGLALCMDYTALPFRKSGPALEFLSEHLQIKFHDGKPLERREWGMVETTVRGLKFNVTHRKTKQKFTAVGLTKKIANDESFYMEDPDGKNQPIEVDLVKYFKKKYDREITFKYLPCLDFSKNGKKNYVPLEFCVLVEGQIFPKEGLVRDSAKYFKDICLAKPGDRKNFICKMIQASDGPCGGETSKNFNISVSTQMTEVMGRVIEPPSLKLTDANGRLTKFTHDRDDCQWNLTKRSVLEGKQISRWAILDLTSNDSRFNKLNCDKFISGLVDRCRRLRINIENQHPLVISSNMNVLSCPNKLRDLLKQCNDGAGNGGLQILICVMTKKDPGYKNLKLISETEIGVLTQCCLVQHANKSDDQYLANLSLKINAKLGGSNMELFDRLPRFEGDDHVMFIGADVNHPAPRNTSCPSFAAVVATMNWPAANKYVARIRPQEHRMEKIQNFGEMCLDLLNTYARINQVKPGKIVVFRDGVSEGQFHVVLNEELMDLKRAINSDGYSPTITIVIAQKRHQTRFFPKDRNQGSANGNVCPGTVVDTKVVQPWGFDFYLCSHFGTLGTSKATHYHVLYDEHRFTSDELEKLIYHMCFTFSRCTKPVSLVPPVYWADLAAFRGMTYYEALVDFGSPTLAVSSSSSSSSSYDAKFFRLHTTLENLMFFC